MAEIELGGEEDRWMTAYVSDICWMCSHLTDPAERKCEAFPNGIPREIWLGENDHKSPYPGDNGIQFEDLREEKS